MQAKETSISSSQSQADSPADTSDYSASRMFPSRALLLLSGTFSLIFLFTGPMPDKWPLFKVTSIVLLAVLGFRISLLLGVALSFGALGDLLLDVTHIGSLDSEQLFLFGLVSFLLGHLVYIVMFRRKPRANLTFPRALGILAVIVALSSMLSLLYKSLGPLLVPVVIYALVLATMAISAQLAQLGNSLAAVGALFFVASDAMLAVGKFRSPFPASFALIWVSYYLAQLLIYLGVARYTFRKLQSPARIVSARAGG
jgi:uncharacterized membrane protein YhhN